MHLIGHRAFDDEKPIQPFQVDGAGRLSGVELDIRCNSEGALVIDHAPVFMLRSRRLKHIPKSIQAGLFFLANEFPGLNRLMLDVKSTRAAAALGAYLADHPQPFALVFNCWHGDDVAAIRTHLPEAEIYYCLAPIFSRRVPQGRFNDLYLSNSFPFFSSRRRFKPALGKPNRHNLNVKLISSKKLEAHLPDDIDGICVHRLFCGAELQAFAGLRKLGVAVYGIAGFDAKQLAKVAPFADYAIIRSGKQGRRRRSRNSHGTLA